MSTSFIHGAPERAALVAVAGMLALLPWLEAGGEPGPAIWLDTLAHLLGLFVVATWLAGLRAGEAPAGAAAWWPLGFVLLLSARGAAYPYAAAITLFEMGTGLAVAAALAVLLAGERPRLAAARLWVVALVPAAVAAMGQVLSGDGRGRAGLVNPNHLAALLAAGLPLAVSLAAAAGNPAGGRRRVSLAWALPVLLAAGVLATASRGALLALLLVGAAWALGRPRVWRRRRLAAACAVAVLLLAGGGSLWWRFAGGDDIYRYDRLRIWPQALVAAAASPWLGIGPGQFRHQAAALTFPREDAPVRYGRGFHTPHSHPLLWLAETGVLGTLAVGLALAGTIRAGRRRWRDLEGQTARRLAGAATAGLGVMGVISLFDEPLTRPPVLLAAAVLAALALPPPRAAGWAATRRLTRATLLTGLAAAAAGLLVLPAAAQGLGLAAAAEPDPAARVRLYRRAATLNPHHPFLAGEEAAVLLSHAAQPMDVLSYGRIRGRIDEALAGAPRETAFLMTRARLERRACVELFRTPATCEEAVGDYRKAVATAPRDPRILLEEAGYLSLLGRDVDAATLLEQAVMLEPGFVRAWSELVRLREEGVDGDRAAARAGLQAARERAARLTPDSGYARDILAPARPAGDTGRNGGGR